MDTTTVKRTQTYRRGRRNPVPCQAVCDEQPQKNRVVIENGEVKTLLFTETISPEEARRLLHDMIDLEYSLP